MSTSSAGWRPRDPFPVRVGSDGSGGGSRPWWVPLGRAVWWVRLGYGMAYLWAAPGRVTVLTQSRVHLPLRRARRQRSLPRETAVVQTFERIARARARNAQPPP